MNATNAQTTKIVALVTVGRLVSPTIVLPSPVVTLTTTTKLMSLTTVLLESVTKLSE